MRDEVCIVGMGYTKFGGLWNKNVGDLVIDATFEDAGIEPKDIGAVW